MNLKKIEEIVTEVFCNQTLDEGKEIVEHIGDAARVTAKLIARIVGLQIEENLDDQARGLGLNDDLLVDLCFQKYENSSS